MPCLWRARCFSVLVGILCLAWRGLGEMTDECEDVLKGLQNDPPQVQRGEPRRAAVVLRGSGFRNRFLQHNQYTCCNGSMIAQKKVFESHTEHLFPAIERATGAEIDVYISTYHCSNGLDWASQLALWYGPRLAGFFITTMKRSNQHATTQRAIAAVRLMEENMVMEYEFVFILRLDIHYGHITSNHVSCLVNTGRCLNWQGLYGTGGNQDWFNFVPRGYFQYYAAKVRDCHVPTDGSTALSPTHGNLTAWTMYYAGRFITSALKKRKKEYDEKHPRDEDVKVCLKWFKHPAMDTIMMRCGYDKPIAATVPACLGRPSGRGRLGKLVGENFDPSCACDGTLAQPVYGPYSLKELVTNMQTMFADQGLSCTVDFDGKRVEARPHEQVKVTEIYDGQVWV